MKQYTFIRTGGDKKHIEAMSLKKAIKNMMVNQMIMTIMF